MIEIKNKQRANFLLLKFRNKEKKIWGTFETYNFTIFADLHIINAVEPSIQRKELNRTDIPKTCGYANISNRRNSHCAQNSRPVVLTLPNAKSIIIEAPWNRIFEDMAFQMCPWNQFPICILISTLTTITLNPNCS